MHSGKNSCEVLCSAVQLFLTAVLYLENCFKKSTAVAVLWGTRFHSALNRIIRSADLDFNINQFVKKKTGTTVSKPFQ